MNKIFLKAAKLIDRREERFSCNAVDSAQVSFKQGFSPETLARTLYAKYMSPKANRPVDIKDFEELDGGATVEARLHRVMALLLIGEAWEDL